MKKYLLPSAIILVLGLGLAVAQNITKSVQISQFPNGPIGMDASNNVFFPAHLLSVGRVPAVSSPAGTAPTILAGSNDFAGQFTGGSAGDTTATVTFTTAYGAAPTCFLVQSGGTASTLAYTTSATSISLSSNLGTGIINYLCTGAQ